MEQNDRLRLLSALIAASNAFHDTLEQHGYAVSYSSDLSKIGSIRDTSLPEHEQWSLGELSINWNLNAPEVTRAERIENGNK